MNFLDFLVLTLTLILILATLYNVTLLNYTWNIHTTDYLNQDCPYELPSMRGSQGCSPQYA
jgi:hypothetical protein